MTHRVKLDRPTSSTEGLVIVANRTDAPGQGSGVTYRIAGDGTAALSKELEAAIARGISAGEIKGKDLLALHDRVQNAELERVKGEAEVRRLDLLTAEEAAGLRDKRLRENAKVYYSILRDVAFLATSWILLPTQLWWLGVLLFRRLATQIPNLCGVK